MRHSREIFEENINSLRRFKSEYIEKYKDELMSSGVVYLAPRSIPKVEISNGVANDGPNAEIPEQVVTNAYVRACNIYCAMLWVYWEVWTGKKDAKDELGDLKALRDSIFHNDGDISKTRQGDEKIKLEKATQGKPFTKGNYILMSGEYIEEFTKIIDKHKNLIN